jgi:hypothetical protein
LADSPRDWKLFREHNQRQVDPNPAETHQTLELMTWIPGPSALFFAAVDSITYLEEGKTWEALESLVINGAGVIPIGKAAGKTIKGLSKAKKITGSKAVKAKSKTVWDDITATQPSYLGTLIPKSFEIQVGTNRVWVHGNASEHLYEAINSYGKNAGKQTELYSQILLTDFQNALASVTKNGIHYEELMTVGNWEFKFGKAKETGQLPVLFHSVFKGWGH